MAQTSILGRIGQLVRANINAILDERRGPGEDARPAGPGLHQQHRRGRGGGRPDRSATCACSRTTRARRARPSAEWLDKAKAASRPRRRSCAPRATRPRPTGSTSLAKIALRRQLSFEEQAETLETQIAAADRARRQAQGRPQQAARQARGARPEARRAGQPGEDGAGAVAGPGVAQERLVMDPTSELNPLRGADPAPGGAGPRHARRSRRRRSTDQFAALESGEDELEVDARLAELKGKALGSGAPAIGSGEG